MNQNFIEKRDFEWIRYSYFDILANKTKDLPSKSSQCVMQSLFWSSTWANNIEQHIIRLNPNTSNMLCNGRQCVAQHYWHHEHDQKLHLEVHH
jgi:hypothetical protein